MMRIFDKADHRLIGVAEFDGGYTWHCEINCEQCSLKVTVGIPISDTASPQWDLAEALVTAHRTHHRKRHWC